MCESCCLYRNITSAVCNALHVVSVTKQYCLLSTTDHEVSHTVVQACFVGQGQEKVTAILSGRTPQCQIYNCITDTLLREIMVDDNAHPCDNTESTEISHCVEIDTWYHDPQGVLDLPV